MKKERPVRHKPLQLLICSVIGHKPYRPNVFDGKSLMETYDALGEPLFKVDLCCRCKTLYWYSAIALRF